MKKLFALLLVAGLGMSLVGCGGGETKPPGTKTPTDTPAPVDPAPMGETPPADPATPPPADPTTPPATPAPADPAAPAPEPK